MSAGTIAILLASTASALGDPSSPPAAAATAKAAAPAPVKPVAPEVGLHALGAASAQNLRMLQLSPEEIEIVKRGFAEALSSPKPLPPPDAAGFDEFVRQRLAAAAAANKESGKAFATKAATEKGAQTLASGAVYRSLGDGSGATPKATDVVKAELRGTLTDGTVFDQGSSNTFSMNGTLPCLADGIAKMKPGGKARLVCPSDTAFGDKGRPPVIPPGATIVFDVALISAQAAPAMTGHGHGEGLPPGHPPMDAPTPSGTSKAAAPKKK